MSSPVNSSIKNEHDKILRDVNDLYGKGPTLKLYVWEGVLTDYTDGIMFALASSVEEAREMISEADSLAGGGGDIQAEPKVYDSPVGFAVWGGA